MDPMIKLQHLWLSFCLGLASVWMAILAPNPSQSLFLLRRRPPSPSRPSIKLPLKFTTIANLSSPAPTPLVTEEDDSSSSSPLPPPATTAVTVGCKTCGREEIVKGCNGEGRIQGGIATVPGFGWWPIKAYRPCPGFTASGGRYRRRGQSMDEVASGRGKARGGDDKVKSSSKKSQPQL